mgnify:CR=1 FL=1
MTDKSKKSNQYQNLNIDKTVKFYVTYDEEQNCFIADVFDAALEEQDYGKAYIESFEFDTMQEAIEDLNNYQLGLTIDDLK